MGKHIQAIHNTFIINEHKSFEKHRCYTYKGKCICECLDSAAFPINRFQENTEQGAAAGKTSHRGYMDGQTINDKITWARPHGIPNAREIAAIKKCCEKEIMLSATIINPAHNCAEVRRASKKQIAKRISELETTNLQIIDWLTENNCYHKSDKNGKYVTSNAYTDSPTFAPTLAPTRRPACKEGKLLTMGGTGKFEYFNDGHAKGCEHRNHYLYEYKGSDCVWTSSRQEIAFPDNYDALFVRFLMMESSYRWSWKRFGRWWVPGQWGNLEDSDFLSIKIRKCHADGEVVKGSCGKWYDTVKLQDSVMGWRWTAVNGAPVNANFNGNSDWKNYIVPVVKTDKTFQIQVRLHSDDDHNERHVLDSLGVYGSCK